MSALWRRLFVAFGWRLHRAIFRATGGRVGGRIGSLPVLMLTTRGRKSGKFRDVPLNYLRDDGAFVVVASYAGQRHDPAWWRNLKADPEAEVLAEGKRARVRAREAEGARRELLWARFADADRSYREYQRRTSRRIPIVLLEPVEAGASP